LHSRILLAFTCLIFFSVFQAPVASGTELKIEPGYSPEQAEDEQGVWMELEEYERAIQRSALLVDDPEINAYVSSTACRVARDYCTDLRIYVIRNPFFNALMTANGVMQIWTGLLVRVSSEDELAAIMGHELAHYTQLHTLERFRRLNRSLTIGSLFDIGMLLLTGYSTPVGQLAAMANAMAFSRDQEMESDIVGARFMAWAGYDPHAAVDVWQMIVNEETSAIAKTKEPGIFTRTHPAADDRIAELQEFVAKEYADSKPDPLGRQRHLAMLNNHYMMLMEDQLDTSLFGRTQAILERHAELGVRENLLHFFQGEMYRQRQKNGDNELAMAAYILATQGKEPVPDAYLNLGYLLLKKQRISEARSNFRKYLELRPDSDDRAMIEFYLEES
jgi:predicted Zn-dependent protease